MCIKFFDFIPPWKNYFEVWHQDNYRSDKMRAFKSIMKILIMQPAILKRTQRIVRCSSQNNPIEPVNISDSCATTVAISSSGHGILSGVVYKWCVSDRRKLKTNSITISTLNISSIIITFEYQNVNMTCRQWCQLVSLSWPLHSRCQNLWNKRYRNNLGPSTKQHREQNVSLCIPFVQSDVTNLF